jgi:hypothetical protein
VLPIIKLGGFEDGTLQAELGYSFSHQASIVLLNSKVGHWKAFTQ